MKNVENIKTKKEIENKQLILIPKIEDYIEYVLSNIIYKLPRIEKFSIGNEYKKSMYETLEYTLYISKINEKINKNILSICLNYINLIDAKLSCQRIYLRIMKKEKWIDTKKFDVAMSKIYEIGKIVGGLVKYYAKNY
ncbi:MAG: four helix bundle protein [Clostridia bacterium]